MIKSVLMADVNYAVKFNGGASSEARTQAINELALSLKVKVEAEASNQARMSGKQLVWGVRDDAVLAMQGYQLAPTGGTGDRSILSGSGPISEIDSGDRVRRNFPDKTSFIRHDVTPLKQATPQGCWATVYAMLEGWERQSAPQVSEALRALKPTYLQSYVNDTAPDFRAATRGSSWRTQT
ncbi:hypothetical protein C8J35_11619 [Rhizobium sp. PP-F2F-G38]|nr:hypothetical protein C8J35_11619 [Rhizobium sp. PP-F2F-G38]